MAYVPAPMYPKFVPQLIAERPDVVHGQEVTVKVYSSPPEHFSPDILQTNNWKTFDIGNGNRRVSTMGNAAEELL